MNQINSTPAPLRQKFWLTGMVGILCLLVGIAMFLLWKDRTMLFLSFAVFAMCIGKAMSYRRILTDGAYEVVEGTCVAISSKPMRRYRKIKIMDNDGNEGALLLSKQAKIKIGYRYRFYFSDTQRLTIGNEYIDSSLSSDYFLGYEELGVFAES